VLIKKEAENKDFAAAGNYNAVVVKCQVKKLWIVFYNNKNLSINKRKAWINTVVKSKVLINFNCLYSSITVRSEKSINNYGNHFFTS